MKKFTRNIRRIRKKAEEFKAALESMPPKVAEFREAFAMTTGQLRHLRDEFETTVSDLTADSEERIIQAMEEIKQGTDIIREAGFELSGIDMEVRPAQRLIVLLDRMEDVRDSVLRSLVDRNKNHKTMHAILTSLLHAESISDKVDMPGLLYNRLIIHIGPMPKVRLSWRTEAFLEEESHTETPAAAQISEPTPAPVSSTVPASKSPFGEDSFFARQPEPEHECEPKAEVESKPDPNPAPAPTTSPAATPKEPSREAAWSSDALARFKKMPGTSKYR